MKRLSRLPAMASAIASSAPPSPYISAVSISVIPSSSPSRMAATSAARSDLRSPMRQVPSPSTGTLSPDLSVTVCIGGPRVVAVFDCGRGRLSIIDRVDKESLRMKVSSTEFQQNVGRYQDVALREPVTITKNGRDHTVLVSAEFFETVMKGRVSRHAEDLDEATIKAIAEAEVPFEYAHLDDELKSR